MTRSLVMVEDILIEINTASTTLAMPAVETKPVMGWLPTTLCCRVHPFNLVKALIFCYTVTSRPKLIF